MKTPAETEAENQRAIQSQEMMRNPATASLGNKPVVQDDRPGFDASFQTKLNAMIAASGGRLKLVSGVRSNARQQQLWDAAVKKYGSAKAARKWVAVPGSSNHEKGLAADLGGDLAWAKANAARFGLHMPMAHEPWHVEPVDLKSSKRAYTTPPDESGGAGTVASPSQPDESASRKTIGFQLNSLVSLLASGGNEPAPNETGTANGNA